MLPRRIAKLISLLNFYCLTTSFVIVFVNCARPGTKLFYNSKYSHISTSFQFAVISTQANKRFTAIRADSYIFSSCAQTIFGFKVDRLLIRLRILLRSLCASSVWRFQKSLRSLISISAWRTQQHFPYCGKPMTLAAIRELTEQILVFTNLNLGVFFVVTILSIYYTR